MKLNNCELTEKNCRVLATVLSSKTTLKEMNLNNSCLLDSGVKEICEGLKNPVCELKILKLNNCALTEESFSALASVLSSDSSRLKDLDLSNNNLRDSGVMLVSDGLKENCKLEKLRQLSDCSITEEGYKALASALSSNPSHLIELDLTGNDPGQSGVKHLSDLLQDPNCQLKLSLRKCGLTEKSCSALATVLKSNSSLKELDMSDNNLQDSGVKKLLDGLENTNYTLENLRLNKCNLTDRSCSALAAVLGSDTSLKELNMNNNNLQDSGVKVLCTGLESVKCKLEILR
uniref:Uncharacterized protein n=1 Tax=Cyprinus carpio TaxID=7962 RepID=A0A8C1QRP8_CYPCA